MNQNNTNETIDQWTPNIEEVNQSILMLQALRDPTRNDHIMAVKSLEENVRNSSFVLNMLNVFTNGLQYQELGLTSDLRQLAGLTIKNYVFPFLIILPINVQLVLKKQVIFALNDQIPDIRKIAAILVGKISESFPITTWFDIIPPILENLDISNYHTNHTSLDGALQAIQKLCEDSSWKLSTDEVNRPLESLIPKLLGLLQCPDDNIRLKSLESYNSLLFLLNPPSTHSSSSRPSRNTSFDDLGAGGTGLGSPPGGSGRKGKPPSGNPGHPLVVHMNGFIQILAFLSNDSNSFVRKGVCQAITILASIHIAVLDQYFPDICQFMLQALLDSVEGVAVEACEFWLVLLENGETKRVLMGYLKPLVENLISRLILTQEQMEQERIDEEEESSGEKDLNIKPLHHRSNNEPSDPDEFQQNNDLSSKWTLRKQAALTLDNIAVSIPSNEVLSFALPKIQECFQSENVLIKESGMLALGALSTGCVEAMEVYIPQLFPFWIQNMLDPLPEMRSISCWVLSRYCNLFEGNIQEGRVFYKQALHSLLNTMFDQKPKVQVAACSALCLLIENSFYIPKNAENSEEEVNVISEDLFSILTAINSAFQIYGIKSSLILVDTIGTIADTVREELQNPRFTPLYLPRLIEKFDKLDDFDMRMFPVMECLTSVLSVIGLEAQIYIQQIYMRSLRILDTTLKANSKNRENLENEDPPSKDFAICSLDVISAICEGLGHLFGTLVGDTNTINGLLELMFNAIHDDLPELRQGGFSLSGELCKQSISLISPEIATQIIELAIVSLNPENPLVCNNAAWTVGELSLQVNNEFIKPYLTRLMYNLILALQSPELQDQLKINVAVTIGRLSYVSPIEIASLAEEFFADWCSILALNCQINERVQAFSGLLSILNQNPSIVIDNKTNIYALIVACVSWNMVPPENIKIGLKNVILGIKNHNLPMWEKIMGKFGNEYSISLLMQLYDL